MRKCLHKNHKLRYSSGSSSDDSEDFQPRPVRKRKIVTWRVEEVFDCKDDAAKFVKSKNTWVYKSKYEAVHSIIFTYVCRDKDSCTSKCRIMLPLNNSNAIVESTSGEHDHAPKDKCGEFLRLRQ